MMRGEEQLDRFRRAMQHELIVNRHKGDWLENDREYAAFEVLYHAIKLIIAMRHAHRDAILEYAADTANCAMMAAHSTGALDAGRLHPGLAERLPGATWRLELPAVKAQARRQTRRLLGVREPWRVTLAWLLRDYRGRAGAQARAYLRARHREEVQSLP